MKTRVLLLTLLLVLLSVSPVLSAEAEETRELPILMYHSVSATRSGVYLISPETLAEDLRALKAKGYESVTLAEVKAFLKGYGDLPARPILLTFDDGHYDNAYYAKDILRREGYTAVLNAIGCFTEYSSTHEKDHPEYSHLTWEEIGELARSGVFEIGNHTYAMHAYKPRFGVKRRRGESAEAHRRALESDLDKMESALLGKSGVIPVAFAYPFGAYDEESKAIVTARYEAVFTCYERINTLKKGSPAKLSSLWRINRDGTLSTVAFLRKHGL